MSLQEIPIEDIYVSESAAQNARRRHFRDEEFEDLVASIAEYGVLQPLIVRPRPAEGGYTHEIVAGERRFLAAAEAGLKKVPAVARELTDEQVLEVQLIENLQRKDLHPMQEAEGYQELMQKHGHTADELADRLGKSRGYVYGRIKLLALCKEAREAFHEDRISASVALLVARIPSDKLQAEALGCVLDPDGGTVGYREAQRVIHDQFMLRLKDAPFAKDDATLTAAGPCTTCPKRTGNQAELFEDVNSADVCTDPPCFQEKRKAHGLRQLAQHEAEGKPVIKGAAAKKLVSYGQLQWNSGYKLLDEKNYDDPKYRTNRKIVGKDAEITLIQDPKSGEVLEAVTASVVQSALRKVKAEARKAAPPADDSYSAQQRKRQQDAKVEKQFRRALFAAVKPSLAAPAMREIVRFVLDEIDYERRCALAAALEIDSKDPEAALEEHVKGLDDAALPVMLAMAMLAEELVVHSYSMRKPERMLAAAEVAGVDVKAVRKSVTPKKKAKKEAAKKGSRKKAAA